MTRRRVLATRPVVLNKKPDTRFPTCHKHRHFNLHSFLHRSFPIRIRGGSTIQGRWRSLRRSWRVRFGNRMQGCGWRGVYGGQVPEESGSEPDLGSGRRIEGRVMPSSKQTPKQNCFKMDTGGSLFYPKKDNLNCQFIQSPMEITHYPLLNSKFTKFNFFARYYFFELSGLNMYFLHVSSMHTKLPSPWCHSSGSAKGVLTAHLHGAM